MLPGSRRDGFHDVGRASRSRAISPLTDGSLSAALLSSRLSWRRRKRRGGEGRGATSAARAACFAATRFAVRFPVSTESFRADSLHKSRRLLPRLPKRYRLKNSRRAHRRTPFSYREKDERKGEGGRRARYYPPSGDRGESPRLCVPNIDKILGISNQPDVSGAFRFERARARVS